MFLLLFLLAISIYLVFARRFTQHMKLIETSLARGFVSDVMRLPTCGVLEIDKLCTALADTQNKLKISAKTREHQLLAAADAGTYTLRLRNGMMLQANDAFLGMLGRSRTGIRFEHKLRRPVWLSLAEYIDVTESEPLRQGLAVNVSPREELLAKIQLHSDRLRVLWQLATDRETPDIDKLRQMLRLGLDSLGMETGILTEHINGSLYVRYKAGIPLLFEEA